MFPKPYWGYEDIGIFFLILVLLTSVFRLLVRVHVLRRTDLANPSVGLQFGLVLLLTLALYSVLRVRHKQPVLKPLGWVLPRPTYAFAAFLLGASCASAVAIFFRIRGESMPPLPSLESVVLGVVLGPTLEESLFRGCLLPLLAQSTGDIAAVVLTAILFALCHGPSDVAHWISFVSTGVVYGWLRVTSRSTTTAAITHSTYNLVLFLSAKV